jgi:lipoprotein-anchoring transpeptidase ErfK/SrfK
LPPINTPALPPPDSRVRWIDVDLTAQTLTAYEGRTALRATSISTGRSHTPTPVGIYRIYVKFRFDDMRGPGYYLRDVPYTMYFHRGYGIHGTYWHSNFGQQMSHGCVNLPTAEAKWLFNWAEVGTPVSIHY